MKFFTNEVKIALVAIVGIVVLFFGMKFLKGLDFFSTDSHYVMKFQNVKGLSASTPILSDGYKVGSVKGIQYDYDHPGNVTVDVSLNKDLKVPQGTTAEIVSDLMGNVQVNLIMPERITGFLQPGGVINGNLNGGALAGVKDLMPGIKQMIPKLDSILYSVNMLLADPALAGSLHNVHDITANLTTTTRELNQLLATANHELPALSKNASALMTNANGTVSQARGTLGDASLLLRNVNGKVNSVDVEGTMNHVNSLLTNMEQLTAKLNNDKGSLGKLMNDPELYNNLTQTMRDADSLLVNLKAHPKRYVHFSLFGRKDK